MPDWNGRYVVAPQLTPRSFQEFRLVEERALQRRFGDDYRLYKTNVPRWRAWDGIHR